VPAAGTDNCLPMDMDQDGAVCTPADMAQVDLSRWRQQVVLAHAMPMLARGVSVGRVAEASGYASESAFSAMFKSAMGLPPTRLLAQNRARPQAATASSTRA